jgi:hypothetical protein
VTTVAAQQDTCESDSKTDPTVSHVCSPDRHGLLARILFVLWRLVKAISWLRGGIYAVLADS